MHWATQTVTTVGYGDMPAKTPSEIMLSVIWMFIGVFFYSFIIGNFTSIIIGNMEAEQNINDRIKLV